VRKLKYVYEKLFHINIFNETKYIDTLIILQVREQKIKRKFKRNKTTRRANIG